MILASSATVVLWIEPLDREGKFAMEAVDIRLFILLLVGLLIAVAGLLFRRLKARRLPDVPEALFLDRFHRRHEGVPERVLHQRKRVASILGIPAQKLSPEHTLGELSRHFAFLAEFSVAVNDLYDEAAEARRLQDLHPRVSPPETIGELIEDLAEGGKGS
jgi:hypothetical protein